MTLRGKRRLMKSLSHLIGLSFTLSLLPSSLGAAEAVFHELTVLLSPADHRIKVSDRITLGTRRPERLTFFLHEGFKPASSTPGVRVLPASNQGGGSMAVVYEVVLPASEKTFVIDYGGTIDHPLADIGKERARGFQTTAGVISEEGVYLSGYSLWYPRFEGSQETFILDTELPGGWDAVSQGRRTAHRKDETVTRVRWESPEPQEEIYLIAGRFIETSEPAGRIEAMVFLRSPDEALARKYLDATARYVAMYEKLIGPYPYPKFALVENFWETGYGMPSFTLLGPRVIRFPFILHSSYPHEILHNWWGNGVYPDYSKGNWSEGLTAYLSDHLIKEQQGQGQAYRQTTLQKYADYVRKERDFPLTQFRSRHSSSSEAVGYGKSLMFFHMLRREAGDAAFTAALQDFYGTYRFRSASFDEIRKSFEGVWKRDLSALFDQWVNRTGAPMLEVAGSRTWKEDDGYMLQFVVEQIQQGDLFRLQVPVAVTLAGRDGAEQRTVIVDKRREEVRIKLPARPLRVDVDPEFDLFRRLHRMEIPPALSQTFGAEKLLILLPASADKGALEGYRFLAQAFAQSGPESVEVRLDSEVSELPGDRAVTLFGWENAFLPDAEGALGDYDVVIDSTGVVVNQERIAREKHAVVMTARHPDNGDMPLTWVAADLTESIPGLARKLPHYHKYSYLVFHGEAPDNVGKGRWPVIDSPMTLPVPGETGKLSPAESGDLAPREPLAALPPVFSVAAMMKIIGYLADDTLSGRGIGTEGGDLAAEYVAAQFEAAGLEPAGDEAGSYFQTWEEKIGESGRRITLRNVVGVIRGSGKEPGNQSVVVGAHYDHLGRGGPGIRTEDRGQIHPGADDNGSGVAVLVELARVLSQGLRAERSILFVAFGGEESGRIGSRYFAAHETDYPVSRCIAMINLDTVGRLENRKILLLGGSSADEWIHIFQGAGYVTGFQVEAGADDLDASDHVSFQEAGVPAVQLFSGPHLDYHRPSDRADKIDGEGLLKVAAVAREAIEYLADRAEPLTSRLEGVQRPTQAAKKERSVSLGTIPDYGYRGQGCRLSGVVPGAPAESCGLLPGDVIVKIDGQRINSLRDFSAVLKSLEPGDTIAITYDRDGQEATVEAKVAGR